MLNKVFICYNHIRKIYEYTASGFYSRAMNVRVYFFCFEQSGYCVNCKHKNGIFWYRFSWRFHNAAFLDLDEYLKLEITSKC